mmetsp:Transcript_5901/g.11167  ORF Transcript_5901/g.11167 Transcript_5901/m.11167 type:complete len:151 (+) Transcript_5901:161-613(+)
MLVVAEQEGGQMRLQQCKCLSASGNPAAALYMYVANPISERAHAGTRLLEDRCPSLAGAQRRIGKRVHFRHPELVQFLQFSPWRLSDSLDSPAPHPHVLKPPFKRFSFLLIVFRTFRKNPFETWKLFIHESVKDLFFKSFKKVSKQHRRF